MRKNQLYSEEEMRGEYS